MDQKGGIRRVHPPAFKAKVALEAAEEALQRYQAPYIENSDQGIQYTHEDYIKIWKTRDVQISMDGRGRAMDNIFNERFHQSLKNRTPSEIYFGNFKKGGIVI